MMEKQEIARFTVCVTSTEDGTWQGKVEADGKQFWFQSEMQLLNWLLAQYPALLPHPSFPPSDGGEK